MANGLTGIISGFSGWCKFSGGTQEILQLGQLRYLLRSELPGSLPAEGELFFGARNTV